MPVLLENDWESGSAPAEWANVDTPVPTTDEVSSTDPIDGTYSHRLVWDSHQDFHALDVSYPFRRAAIDTPILSKISLMCEDLTHFDRLHFYNKVQWSGSTFVGITIKADGTIEARGGSLGSNGFSSNVLLGSTAAGVITSGGIHTVSYRLVMDNSAGEVQIDVDGSNELDVTGIDTIHGAWGSTVLDWGWEVFVSSNASASGTELKFDNQVFGDDEAAPLDSSPPAGGGGGGLSKQTIGLGLPTVSLH